MLTITLELKIYEEKKTQKTSYISRPVRSSVETLRLGSLTKAINATQRPIPMASIRSQCPVSIQMQTIVALKENETNSATVKRPHTPNDILQQSITIIMSITIMM